MRVRRAWWHPASSHLDALQVDFSCLFDKGLTLDKPEMVPFRWVRGVEP